jgi:hypothetical protein
MSVRFGSSGGVSIPWLAAPALRSAQDAKEADGVTPSGGLKRRCVNGVPFMF